MSRSRRVGVVGTTALLVLLLPLVPLLPAEAAAPAHAPVGSVPGADGTVRSAGIRDPAIAGDGLGRIYVNSTDPLASPNAGLLTNLTGFRVEPFPNASSIQIGVDEVIGPYLVTFGLFQNDNGGAYPFFSIFNSTTGRTLYQGNESYDRVAPGSACDFVLMATNATSWALSFDGQPFGGSNATSVVDLGTDTSSPSDTVALSEIALAEGEVVPSRLDVPTAFGVLRPSGWYLPASANASFLGPLDVAWGIEGRAQSPSLWPGEVVSGTSLTPLGHGATMLWDSGPVPVAITAASDPTTTTGTGATEISAAVTSDGQPLDGLPLAVSDDLGGLFGDPYGASDGNGSFTTTFLAPNVSAPSTDRVRIASRALGAAGSAVVPIAVGVATEVEITAIGLGPIVRGDGAVFQILATDPSGRPLPDVLLELDLLGAGALVPPAGYTDASGHLNVSLATNRSATSLAIGVAVDSPGYWGHREIPVALQNPAAPWTAQVVPYLPDILLVAIVAAGVGLLLRRRLPKSPMRPMTIPRPPRPGPAAPAAPSGSPDSAPPGGGDRDGPGLSRTPP